jgi:hypothetical protein
MSTIFDDETAASVRDDYRGLLDDGYSAPKATEELIDDYEELLADDDEAPMVWLGLAAAQLEQGQLQPQVKEKALEAIETGAATAPTRRPLSEIRREHRAAAVAELRDALT